MNQTWSPTWNRLAGETRLRAVSVRYSEISCRAQGVKPLDFLFDCFPGRLTFFTPSFLGPFFAIFMTSSRARYIILSLSLSSSCFVYCASKEWTVIMARHGCCCLTFLVFRHFPLVSFCIFPPSFPEMNN